MSTVPTPKKVIGNGYPTTDGKPMAETDLHRDLMLMLIEMLKEYYRDAPRTYVSGNLLVFYEQGNRRRHVSPDVFVVRGVPKQQRINYLVWEEGKAPEFVIELTSSSTRNEDLHTKFDLYQDTLRVKEYFLFDPYGDYLSPQLQGYRLRQGVYRPIRPVDNRLPSQVVRLHLEAQGNQLRLFDPETGAWLPTPGERIEAADQARENAEQAREEAEQALQQQQSEVERLRRENEELRERLGRSQ